MRVKIKENSWLARVAAGKLKSEMAAIVFGSTVYLHNTTRKEFLADTGWVCHELKHVQQYREHGFIRFMARYLIEWVKKGYYKNKFEVEARESEEDRSLLEKVEFV